MNKRSATATIKGYVYQFDMTIKTILNSNNDEIITIENIEDIDVNTPNQTTAIQCKYYEGTTYNHSQVKKSMERCRFRVSENTMVFIEPSRRLKTAC